MARSGAALASVLVPCGAALACTLLAAWRAPSAYTYLGALGALAAGTAALRSASRAARAIHAGGTRQAALEAEVEKLERRVKLQAEQLHAAMTTDEVTGVLNRSTLLERLDEALARDERLGKSLSVLYVDVEGFRGINRKHSRLGGDSVLRHVARALQGVSRGTDYVGRLGGDEFAAVLGECRDPAPVVDRLLITLSSPPPGEERLGRIAVAVGAVVVEEPIRGMDPSSIFREAEEALQSVRGKGESLCARRTLAGKTAARSSR